MKAYKYRTLADVLAYLSDGARIDRRDVRPSVLNARVWVAGAGQPGCLYDYGPNYHASKRAAIADLYWVADSDSDRPAPRGFRRDLERFGHAIDSDRVRHEVSADRLRSILP